MGQHHLPIFLYFTLKFNDFQNKAHVKREQHSVILTTAKTDNETIDNNNNNNHESKTHIPNK